MQFATLPLQFAGLALAVLLGTTSAAARDLASAPQISVSGSAAVRAAPDEVLLSVGVETRNQALATATRLNSERVTAALTVLRAHGVPEKDVQLDHIQVEPMYDNGDRLTPTGFRARKRIGVRLSRPDSLERLLTALYAAGVNDVDNIEFRTTELRKHRDKARELAVVAAREKADALTAQLGAKRGRILQISESSGYSYGGSLRGRFQNQQNVVQMAPSDGPAEAADTGLATGQISVTATVNLVFALD